MQTSSERVRLGDGLKHSREASALLAATLGSVSRVQDAEVRQLALAALEAVAKVEARLQLLDEAYRIADRHRATDLLGTATRAIPAGQSMVVAVDASGAAAAAPPATS